MATLLCRFFSLFSAHTGVQKRASSMRWDPGLATSTSGTCDHTIFWTIASEDSTTVRGIKMAFIDTNSDAVTDTDGQVVVRLFNNGSDRSKRRFA